MIKPDQRFQSTKELKQLTAQLTEDLSADSPIQTALVQRLAFGLQQLEVIENRVQLGETFIPAPYCELARTCLDLLGAIEGCYSNDDDEPWPETKDAGLHKP